MKGLSRVVIGSIAGGLLGAAAFFAVFLSPVVIVAAKVADMNKEM